MKRKYLLSAILLLSLIGLLAACGQKEGSSGTLESTKTAESDASEKNEESSVDRSQEPSEVMIGKVKEAPDGEYQRLVLESLVPADTESETSPFDEVVLLTEGVTIVDGAGKALSVEQIEVGATIEVTLIKDSPVASSLPPQIPGMSMIKIVVP